jgi:NADH:ubiquinone oxidoreductase subunit F (NADH-binding)
MVGSGGLVVMNKNTCMVSVARFFMQFTQHDPAASAFSAAKEQSRCLPFSTIS